MELRARPVIDFLNGLYGDVQEEGIAQRMALDEVRGVNIADLKPADSEFQLVTLKAKDVRTRGQHTVQKEEG